MNTKPSPAVVYRRVSSAQQGRGTDRTDGGWSLQSQEAKTSDYAQRHGLSVVKFYEEVASASKRGRSVFGELVAYLREHPGTALVVEKLDRLARNSSDLAVVDDLLDHRGVVIHLVRDGKVLHAGSSPGERLSSDIEGAVAKHYSRNLGREVRKGIDQRFAEGYFPMGNPPFGYVYPPARPREKVNIVPDPKAATVVRKLFEAYVAGEGLSFRELVELARKLGYPRRMNASYARVLLKNPTYAGWIRHNGETQRGLHEPIVSQELFDRAQERMASRPRTSRPNRPRTKLLHAFSGIFECACCGGPIGRHMRTHHGGSIYWYCRDWCDAAKYFPETALYEQVIEHLQALHLPKAQGDRIVAAMRKQTKTKGADAEILAAIKREQQGRTRLLDALQAGDITGADFTPRKLESERKEAALRQQLERLRDQSTILCAVDVVANQIDRYRDLPVLFSHGTKAEQRTILGILWETSGGKSKLDGQARRIQPEWRPIWSALLDAGTVRRQPDGSMVGNSGAKEASGPAGSRP